MQDLHQFAHYGWRGTQQAHNPTSNRGDKSGKHQGTEAACSVFLIVFRVAANTGCGEVDQRSGHGGQQEPVLSV